MIPASATPLSFAHITPGSPWWIYAIIIGALAAHIGGGSIAILSGYGAVMMRKGGQLHALFGKIFLLAMILMGVAATGLAIDIHQRGNIGGGIVAAYLVVTGWMAVRRAPGSTGLFEKLACLAAFATSAMFIVWGLQAIAHPVADDPAIPYFVFAALTAFFGALDMRVILRGGLTGTARIARHLWRMCFALFFAAGSFFIGQQKVMPLWIQGSPVLFVLGLAPLAFLLFWMVRVRLAGWRMRRAAAA